MSSGASKRLVLNSHRLFRDITPEVFNELPSDEGFVASPTSGDLGLYATIRDGNHKIILTQGITSQYSREVQREGYSEILLILVIEHLEDMNLIVRPRLPGGRPSFRGIPQRRHSAFLTDAIQSGADYFVTENPVWLQLSDAMLNDHNVRVTTPGGFIQREGI